MQTENKRTLSRLLLHFLLPLLLTACLGLCPVAYTYGILAMARGQGVYATPQEGVAERAKAYLPDYPHLVIDRAGPNAHDGSNPHIWYVIWKVCKASTANFPVANDCTGGGNYYLHARDGWVYLGEGYFPEFVGGMMKALGLAAPE